MELESSWKEDIVNKTKVALIRCEKYDDAQVLKAIKRGIDLLGSISLFVKPGDKIVLKPNVLLVSDPEKCSPHIRGI